METRKLPIGVDSFEKIRTEGFYYVDKSLLIRDLLNRWCEVNLFTRPRRFGKTLNMSMLKSFFEIGGDNTLFDGLAIANEKKLIDEYMGKYPVIFISLKNVDGEDFSGAYGMLKTIVNKEARRFQFLLQSDALTEIDKNALRKLYSDEPDLAVVKDSLLTLSELLYAHYNKKVILLIDEYDVPLDKAYQHGYYEEMLDLIRAIFNSALKGNDNLYFAVMTGCLRISKESIFTGLNNLKVHSIVDTQFDELFGFTDAEVARILTDYGLLTHREEIKEWYDGYRFGEQDVYCPWDVINYCYDLLVSDKARPQAYWLNTSGNDMVRRLIDRAGDGASQMEIERLIEGQSISKALNDRLTHNEVDASVLNVWSLLFMTGYLTVRGTPRGGIYDLAIPNREVRGIYIDQIRAWFQQKTSASAETLRALFRAFEDGNTPAIKNTLNEQLLNTISFHDAHESFYHGFLLALLGTCDDWYVSSNAETGKGRSDIMVERKDRKRGLIVEIKDVKDPKKLDAACASAIRQIEEKNYAAAMRRYRIKDIRAYGIAFCDKECAVLTKRID